LAAGDNICVVNCTTAAQYFHLLRRQAARLQPGAGWGPRPLVVMSPKSLLRHPLAASRLGELAYGSFQRVIDEGPPGETAAAPGRDRETNVASPADAARRTTDARRAVTRLVLCSGKIAVDLHESELRQTSPNVAVARVEELYPFPRVELEAVLAGYPQVRQVLWVQEESENMGAWSYMAPRLRDLVGPETEVLCVARPPRSSPAVGSAVRHAAEQVSIVASAFEESSRRTGATAGELSSAPR
jgi:2-oxoglutarate dehydrogenase E1 component